MMRTLKIKGDDNKSVVAISIDGNVREFDLAKDIAAEEIYAVLGYKRGDTYNVEPAECGSIDETAFAAFCGLLESIAEKVNEYAEEIDASEEVGQE